MKALLIDVQRDTVEYVEPQGLADFYRLIDCDLIDITCREINGRRYDIICDDCGWFRDDVKFSAVTAYGNPVLVGNLIITGEADADGDQTDLQPRIYSIYLITFIRFVHGDTQRDIGCFAM